MTDLLLDLVKRHLAPFVGNLWDSLVFWRSVGIAGVVALAAIWASRQRLAAWLLNVGERERARAHDGALFKKMDAALDEGTLDLLRNHDLYNQNISRENIYKILHFCQDFARTENEYIDRTLKDAAESFVSRLRTLERFVAQHFFPTETPGGERRSQFYPDDEVGKLERTLEQVKREKYIKDLNTLIDEAWEAYQRFRRSVKARLQL